MGKEKFKNKYRIGSTRLKNYDYSLNGAYYITIVTKDREHFFGNILHGKIQLSEIGKIAQQYWDEIPQHFPFVKLDDMIVMPNHIHGILWIDKTNDIETSVVVETPKLDVFTKRNKNHKIEWKPGTIGVIINQYKRICTINSRKIKPNFAWQPRFYDRIIRNDNELKRIRKYIVNNPQMWERDRNNM